MNHLKNELADFIRTARQIGKDDKEIVDELLRNETAAHDAQQPPIKNQSDKPVLIRIQNLSKTYRVSSSIQVTALKDVNLEIYRGEFVSITGQSGSGKSTLLNLLALIDDPTAGTIEIAGKQLNSLSEAERVSFRLRTTSMIFQFFNLIENYTASENIIFQLLLQGDTYREAREKSLEMLKYLGLEGKANSYPKDLSGGQQQRIAVGRALAKESLFILADEPTAHLDAKNGQELIDLFRDINNRYQRTIVMVSHEPTQAAQADRIITFEDGAVA